MNNFKELGVVILAVAALLGLGAVAVKRNSEEWKTRKCQDNLHKIYRMAAKYQNDNNGALVPYVDKSNKGRWKFWYMFILKYGDDPTVFYCPANPKAAMFYTEESDPLEPKSFSETAQSYGMNYFLGNNKHELNIDNIAKPADIIYFADSNTPNLRGTKWCWKTDWAPRHQKKANFVFMDGSVKLLGPDSLGICQKWENWKQDRTNWFGWKK